MHQTPSNNIFCFYFADETFSFKFRDGQHCRTSCAPGINSIRFPKFDRQFTVTRIFDIDRVPAIPGIPESVGIPWVRVRARCNSGWDVRKQYELRGVPCKSVMTQFFEIQEWTELDQCRVCRLGAVTNAFQQLDVFSQFFSASNHSLDLRAAIKEAKIRFIEKRLCAPASAESARFGSSIELEGVGTKM